MTTSINRAALASLVHNVQHSGQVQLAYTTNEYWPLPRSWHVKENVVNKSSRSSSSGHSSTVKLELSVLDSSFNPPTKAHFALCNPASTTRHNSDPRSSGSIGDGQDCTAYLLLLSVTNADKALKPSDAGHIQRVEMMALLADDIAATETQNTNNGGVAVMLINEPFFAQKNEKLGVYLQSKFRALGIGEESRVQVDFTWLMGFDTLERLFAPRYYGGMENMMLSLEGFLRHPDGAEYTSETDGPKISYGAKVAWASRKSAHNTPSLGSELLKSEGMQRFIESGRVKEVIIGARESTLSSTLVRRRISSGDEDWRDMVTSSIKDYLIQNGLYRES